MTSFITKRQISSLLCFLMPTILIFSRQKLIDHAFTGWDTHDLSFVNFVYFRDCLASGHIPLWNPFIQSGTFFPSFFQIGFFSPFEFSFALLALILPPLPVYEWMIQFVVLMGGIGGYVFFRSIDVDHDLSCLGATILTITTLVINIGQIWFIFALGALPWMLAIAHAIVEGKWRLSAYPVFGIIFGFAYACGYPWMNLVNTVLFASYTGYIFLSAKRAHMVNSRSKCNARSEDLVWCSES